jgi:hypothetical protein
MDGETAVSTRDNTIAALSARHGGPPKRAKGAWVFPDGVRVAAPYPEPRRERTSCDASPPPRVRSKPPAVEKPADWLSSAFRGDAISPLAPLPVREAPPTVAPALPALIGLTDGPRPVPPPPISGMRFFVYVVHSRPEKPATRANAEARAVKQQWGAQDLNREPYAIEQARIACAAGMMNVPKVPETDAWASGAPSADPKADHEADEWTRRAFVDALASATDATAAGTDASAATDPDSIAPFQAAASEQSEGGTAPPCDNDPVDFASHEANSVEDTTGQSTTFGEIDPVDGPVDGYSEVGTEKPEPMLSSGDLEDIFGSDIRPRSTRGSRPEYLEAYATFYTLTLKPGPGGERQKKRMRIQRGGVCREWRALPVLSHGRYRSINPVSGEVHEDFARMYTRDGHNYDDYSIAVMQHRAHKKNGRPPLFDRALTEAERKRMERAKKSDKPFVLDGEAFVFDGEKFVPKEIT